jgi:hypothetical protein
VPGYGAIVARVADFTPETRKRSLTRRAIPNVVQVRSEREGITPDRLPLIRDDHNWTFGILMWGDRFVRKPYKKSKPFERRQNRNGWFWGCGVESNQGYRGDGWIRLKTQKDAAGTFWKEDTGAATPTPGPARYRPRPDHVYAYPRCVRRERKCVKNLDRKGESRRKIAVSIVLIPPGVDMFPTHECGPSPHAKTHQSIGIRYTCDGDAVAMAFDFKAPGTWGFIRLIAGNGDQVVQLPRVLDANELRELRVTGVRYADADGRVVEDGKRRGCRACRDCRDCLPEKLPPRGPS